MENEQLEKNKQKIRLSLSAIMGGDFLLILQKQIKLIILIIVLCIFYISNRYSFQQEQIEITRLKNQLETARYKAQTRSSQFLKASRQSELQNKLDKEKSKLTIPAQSPFILEKD